MAVIDIRSVRNGSDVATIRFEMVRSRLGARSPLLTQCVRLSKPELDSTFMIFRPFGVCSFFFSGLYCPDFTVELPDLSLVGVVHGVQVLVVMLFCSFCNSFQPCVRLTIYIF